MNNKDMLKKAMKEKGYTTIKELSIATGVSQAYLYCLTGNKNEKLGSRVGEKLNRTLGIKLEYEGARTDIESLGCKLYKLRNKQNFTREKLSVVADISVDTITAIEKNKNKPSKVTIQKLAKAFEINEDELRRLLFEN